MPGLDVLAGSVGHPRGNDWSEPALSHASVRISSRLRSLGTAVPLPKLDVRPTVRTLLAQLEPGIAVVTNRLGDLLAYTNGFDLLARPVGLLDGQYPNLTRFVFTDQRARRIFPEWERIADEAAFPLTFGAPSPRSEQLVADLTASAGPDFTRRVNSRQGSSCCYRLTKPPPKR